MSEFPRQAVFDYLSENHNAHLTESEIEFLENLLCPEQIKAVHEANRRANELREQNKIMREALEECADHLDQGDTWYETDFADCVEEALAKVKGMK